MLRLIRRYLQSGLLTVASGSSGAWISVNPSRKLPKDLVMGWAPVGCRCERRQAYLGKAARRPRNEWCVLD